MGAEVHETRYGKFLLWPEDLIGRTLKAGNAWDGPGFLFPIYKMAGLPDFTRTAIDIGANIGIHSVILSRICQRVIAVEPVGETYQMLVANLDLNNTENVIPLHLAAYDRETYLALTDESLRELSQVTAGREGNLGGCALQPEVAPGSANIPAAPLDNFAFLFDRVALVKCDAQGCDLPAMLGLRETLKRDRPLVVLEHEGGLAKLHGVEGLQDYRAFFSGIGYSLHQWPGRADLLAKPLVRVGE